MTVIGSVKTLKRDPCLKKINRSDDRKANDTTVFRRTGRQKINFIVR
jgi:hypothetical protein